jgi:transcriptional regulator with XRE-family HTH domain
MSPKLREVIRCPRCRLNQFVLASRLCRRCKKPIPAIRLWPVIVVQPPPKRKYKSRAMLPAVTLAERVYMARSRCGLSQGELAKRVGCPRTYISKLETSAFSPYLPQVVRLAIGLGCPIADILPIAPEPTWGELDDPGLVDFMREMFDHVTRLTAEQASAVVHEAGRKYRKCLSEVNIPAVRARNNSFYLHQKAVD